MAVLWHVQLLGDLRAVGADREVRHFRTATAAALFAYLAYHPDRSHPREVLGEMLWPGFEPDAARNNLSTALSSLRHEFEPPEGDFGSVFVADRFTVGVRPGTVQTDVRTFVDALTAARRASGRPEQLRHLRKAARTYAGPLLPGHYLDWVLREQERLKDLFVRAMRTLVRDLGAEGRWEEALAYAWRAVDEEPLEEAMHLDLLRVMLRTGRAATAHHHYAEMAALLARELDWAPSTAAVQLREGIARALEADHGVAPAEEPVADGVPPKRATDRSRGSPAGLYTLVVCRPCGAGSAAPAVEAVPDPPPHITREGLRVWAFRFPYDAARQAGALVRGHALAGAIALDTVAVAPSAEPGDVTGADLEDACFTARSLVTSGEPGQVLCTEQAAALLRRALPEGVRLADAGRRRLADATDLMQVYELTAPGWPERERAPRRGDRTLAALPHLATQMFGREGEIAALWEALDPTDDGETGRDRLVTLVGAPGCGKTRLALEVAQRLEPAYEGAVWFVPLAKVPHLEAAPDAVLTAIGAPGGGRRTLAQAVGTVIEARPALLVLDNLEHLLQDGTSENGGIGPLVAELSAALPTLRVLATSRTATGADGERCVMVRPLPVPSCGRRGSERLETLRKCPSVGLFADRARSVRPGFEVTPSNAASVARLCTLLDGLPLAIELAAARSQTLTPAQLADRLSHGILLPGGDTRPQARRHRTIADAIDWSFRLLPPKLQRFLCDLSVFRSGWTTAEAEEVTGEPLTGDCLALLVDASLVVAEPQGEGIRYRLLEVVRQFAAQRVGDARSRELNERLADWLVRATRDAGCAQNLNQSGRMYDILELERGNIEVTMEYLLRTPAGAPRAAEIAGWLREFARQRGGTARCHAWLRTALDLCPDWSALSMQALAKASEAVTGAQWERVCDAITARTDDQQHAVALSYVVSRRANACFMAGDAATTLRLYDEVAEIARKGCDARNAAIQLMNVASICICVGQYARAAGLLSHIESSEDAFNVTRVGAMANRAYLEGLVGSLAGAEALHLAVEQRLAAENANRALAETLLAYAALLVRAGRFTEAHGLVDRADAIAAKTDRGELDPGICLARGRLQFAAGRAADAKASAECAMVSDETEPEVRIEALAIRGKALAALGDTKRSAESLRDALDLARGLLGPHHLASVLLGVAWLALARGDPAGASRIVGAAEGVRQRAGLITLHGEAKERDGVLARAAQALGDEAAAAARQEGVVADEAAILEWTRLITEEGVVRV